MGFTTGFTGGVTLTLGLAYLSVLAHERNRQNQALALRSQSRVLQGLLDPTPLPPPQTRADLAREERSTLIEAAKDRWNNEIENVVRRVQRTDWNEVREGMEGTVARLIGGGLETSREGIDHAEKAAGPAVQEAIDRSKTATKKGSESAAAGIGRAADATADAAAKAGPETKRQLDHASVKASELSSAARAKAEKAAVDINATAHDAAASAKSSWGRGVEKSQELVSKAEKSSEQALSTGAGTVDAARGAVRNVISKGIEKGKEVIGMATEKAESKVQALSGGSEVEKALHKRYEQPEGLNKSVEQTLAERYKPVEARDNTVLRGV
ncbi:hypothetical protein PVAG01_03912 [Phlyctema vagabunda]|uniref:MICOS complex subunit MIC12 n=1 Tax=Phlyctema vagabunda TaxID=108571 RepID=A0ABR4PMS1_9HELO